MHDIIQLDSAFVTTYYVFCWQSFEFLGRFRREQTETEPPPQNIKGIENLENTNNFRNEFLIKWIDIGNGKQGFQGFQGSLFG